MRVLLQDHLPTNENKKMMVINFMLAITYCTDLAFRSAFNLRMFHVLKIKTAVQNIDNLLNVWLTPADNLSVKMHKSYSNL